MFLVLFLLYLYCSQLPKIIFMRLRIFCKGNCNYGERILEKLNFLTEQNKKIMSDFDDLQALVAKLGADNTAIKTGIATIIGKLPAEGGLTADQVATLKAEATQLVSDSDANVAALASGNGSAGTGTAAAQ